MQYVKSSEDAHEIVNDTFMVIWEKKDELTLDASLKPLLYTIVRNKSLNVLKKRKIDINELNEGFEVMSADPNPVEIIQAKQTEEAVFALIEQLPPKCKQIFVMSRREYLSNKNIAEILEISEKTVENQITIAIKFIKKGLIVKNEKNGNNLIVMFPWVIALLINNH
jgi:RNA polymerase sigma-70 factor (ECF subfamily)